MHLIPDIATLISAAPLSVIANASEAIRASACESGLLPPSRKRASADAADALLLA